MEYYEIDCPECQHIMFLSYSEEANFAMATCPCCAKNYLGRKIDGKMIIAGGKIANKVDYVPAYINYICGECDADNDYLFPALTSCFEGDEFCCKCRSCGNDEIVYVSDDLSCFRYEDDSQVDMLPPPAKREEGSYINIWNFREVQNGLL
jgi:hypothetical protein